VIRTAIVQGFAQLGARSNMAALLLLGSSASALVVGGRTDIARCPAPSMGPPGKFGTGRVAPVPLGGTQAWGSNEQQYSQPRAGNTGKFGVGRMAPVPMGGTQAWGEAQPASPPFAVPGQSPVAVSEKFGVGRKNPVPMGGTQAWGPEYAPAARPANGEKFGVGRKTPVAYGGTKAWEPDNTPQASPGNSGKFGVGRKTPMPMGGI